MGFKASAVMVEAPTVAELLTRLPDSYAFTGTMHLGYDALLPMKRLTAVASAGPWVVLSDPSGEYSFDHELLAELSRGTRVFAFAMQSTVDLYRFCYCTDGSVARLVEHVEGAVREQGDSLEAEEDLDPDVHDEAAILPVLKSVTGWSFEALEDLSFEELRRVPSSTKG